MLDVACGMYLHTRGDVATFRNRVTLRLVDDEIVPPNRMDILDDELQSRGICTRGFGADPSAAQESCRPSAALQSLEDVQADTPLPNVDGITDNTQQPESPAVEEID